MHWEIWNEPNIAGFWRPKAPNAADYVELVKITAPLLRRALPDAVLIGGSYARIPFRYIEECLQAGIGPLIDKLSYHPYRPQPEWNYASEVRALRRLVESYRPGIGLWQGENGAPSSSSKDSTGALSNLAWTETSQAKWLLRRILTDLALDVEVTSYFLIADIVNYITAAGTSAKTNYKGVLRGRDYTRKPSYYALQNLCALFDSETRRTDFVIGFDRANSRLDEMLISSASFARHGAPVYAYWYPADLQAGYAPATVRISIWSGKDAMLRDPVIADPLTGEIRRPEDAKQAADGFWHLERAPLLDYPLLITDSSVVA
jgi:hypothetical protein